MTTHDLPDFGLQINPTTGHLKGPQGTTTLTIKECALLLALLNANSHAVSRQNLLTAAWPPTRNGTARTLDVHIANLRSKLHTTCGPHGARIDTVRGTGYRLLAPGPGPRPPRST